MTYIYIFSHLYKEGENFFPQRSTLQMLLWRYPFLKHTQFFFFDNHSSCNCSKVLIIEKRKEHYREEQDIHRAFNNCFTCHVRLHVCLCLICGELGGTDLFSSKFQTSRPFIPGHVSTHPQITGTISYINTMPLAPLNKINNVPLRKHRLHINQLFGRQQA